MLAEKEIQELISRALEARKNAYAPYSDFRVGAALLSDSGEGGRSFRAICIAGGPGEREPEKPCPPCGVCRQVMLEFCGPDFEVILAVNGQQYEVYTLDRLAPMGFRL